MFTVVARGFGTGVFDRGDKRITAFTRGFKGFRARTFADYYQALAYLELYRDIDQNAVPDNDEEIKSLASKLQDGSYVACKENISGKDPEDNIMDVEEKDGTVNHDVSPGTDVDSNDMKNKHVPVPENFTHFKRDETPSVTVNNIIPKAGPLDWEIFADGSYYINQRTGGFAAALILGGHTDVPVFVSGSRKNPACGSNEMELMAIWKGLKRVSRYRPGGNVFVYSDCSYAVQMVNQVVAGKLLPDTCEPSCKSLLRKIYKISKRFPLFAIWVKGHSGLTFNVACDKLAKLEAGLVR